MGIPTAPKTHPTTPPMNAPTNATNNKPHRQAMKPINPKTSFNHSPFLVKYLKPTILYQLFIYIEVENIFETFNSNTVTKK